MSHPTAPNSHAAITKHADIGVGHHTQKSFKSDRRDKPKHSGKLGSTSGPKKGGAGGKGTWGRPGDEARDLTLDANDPNYDPDEAGEYEPTAGSWDTWHPSDTISLKFATSLSDMAKFKATIKSAAQEYLHSNDAKEFARIVSEFGMSVYHADLPYILIRWGLDHTAEERARINALLLSLHKQGLITQSQMGAGVRKLYNHLPDLLVDCPQAKLHLREHLQFAAAGGLIDPALVKELEDEQAALSDAAKVDATKASIKQIVKEFFVSEDLPDAVKSIEELNAPFLAFEVVKQLISQSLDMGNRQREGASVFLADQHGATLKSCDIEKGFTILLERVEDLALDIPNILKLLSIFVARAVVDEALAPAFLVRVDLTANDLGSRVLAQAQELLKQENASDRLLWVWEDLTAEENAKKGTKTGSASGATAAAAQ